MPITRAAATAPAFAAKPVNSVDVPVLAAAPRAPAAAALEPLTATPAMASKKTVKKAGKKPPPPALSSGLSLNLVALPRWRGWGEISADFLISLEADNVIDLEGLVAVAEHLAARLRGAS